VRLGSSVHRRTGLECSCGGVVAVLRLVFVTHLKRE
jgi:hypothetical protein